MTAVLPLSARRVAKGFTLIELMIAVAIVGILAAIALPAYQNSVIKGKRAQGRAALLDLALAQERWFTANTTYVAVGLGSNTVAGMKMYSGDNATSPPYQLQAAAGCTGATALTQCVVMTAVPTFSDPQGGTLTLWSNGNKTCSGSTPSVCWP